MSSRTNLLAVAALMVSAGLLVGAVASAARPAPRAAAAPPSPAAPAEPSPPGTVPSPPGPTPAAPAATDAAGVDRGPIVLAFAGDVHGERQIAAALAGGEHPLADIAPTLGAADLTIVNLETAVGSRGTPAAKTYTFQAPPALLEELSAAGVDVVNLANNHALDHGQAGLLETLELVERSGLHAVGAGRDEASAYAPSIHELHGRSVAVIGLTRVWPEPSWAASGDRPGMAGAYDIHRAVGAVVEARARADHVVVTIHWGAEGRDCPDENQTELADALLAAGATAVVGHHPHVLQPVEQVGGQFVAYSLGNFLWYAAGEASRLTGVLVLELGDDGVSGWELAPAVVDPRDGGPRPASAADAAAVGARLSRSCPPPG